MRRNGFAMLLAVSLSLLGCGSDDTITSPNLAQEDLTVSLKESAALGPGDNGNGGGAGKVDICHRDDSGEYFVLSIAENAVRGHRRHGDGFPGEEVPGRQAKFLSDCRPIEVGPGIDVLGPDGGSVQSADGRATLTIPEGASDEFFAVAIEPANELPTEDQPDHRFVAGTAYEISFSVEGFGAPPTLSVRYEDSDAVEVDGTSQTAARLEPFGLGLVAWGANGREFVEDSVADTDHNLVTATLPGLLRSNRLVRKSTLEEWVARQIFSAVADKAPFTCWRGGILDKLGFNCEQTIAAMVICQHPRSAQAGLSTVCQDLCANSDAPLFEALFNVDVGCSDECPHGQRLAFSATGTGSCEPCTFYSGSGSYNGNIFHPDPLRAEVDVYFRFPLRPAPGTVGGAGYQNQPGEPQVANNFYIEFEGPNGGRLCNANGCWSSPWTRTNTSMSGVIRYASTETTFTAECVQ